MDLYNNEMFANMQFCNAAIEHTWLMARWPYLGLTIETLGSFFFLAASTRRHDCKMKSLEINRCFVWRQTYLTRFYFYMLLTYSSQYSICKLTLYFNYQILWQFLGIFSLSWQKRLLWSLVIISLLYSKIINGFAWNDVLPEKQYKKELIQN